ncbi:MAG: hypothetical protein JNK75_07050 [Betaproteobacteria bacterium]|nr:hypothetical protein [Betaproteobacteria bacterium]
MFPALAADDLSALVEIDDRAKSRSTPRARFAALSTAMQRSVERLVDVDLVILRKDDSYALTSKGARLLFERECTRTLHALAAQPDASIAPAVAAHLAAQGAVAADPVSGQVRITATGRARLMQPR